MLPTLKEGQIVCIKKHKINLQYDDIVVIKKDKKIIIKRLVGLPKDKINIDNYLYVNDKQYDDYYIKDKGNINQAIYLKDDEFFVLGDNRQNSIDSRFEEVGIINKNEIIGKVIF